MHADVEVNDEWLEQSLSNDKELFSSLVQQTDTTSESECPTQEVEDNSAKCVNKDCELSTTDPPEISDCDQMECFPYSLPDNSPFTIASIALEELARENGFAIHDVPYDGNCMFSAVAYQLQSTGICNVDSSKLRAMLANHLEDNSALYSQFLSQPVASHDAYNADTEPPTDEDAYLDSIADSELSSLLRWENYLIRLRNGA